MKKLLLSILLPFLFLSQLSAQLEFGARGSVAFFLPSGDGAIADRISLLPGGEGGLFAGLALGQIASVRAEFTYISKRWTQVESEPAILTLPDGTNVNGLLERTLRTTNGYFSIPIIFEFQPIKGLGIDIGPNLSFLTQSIATGDLSSISDSLGVIANQSLVYDYINDLAGEGAYEDLPEKLDNLYRSMDIGLNVGLSLKLSNRTRLDVRTNLGMLDVIEASYRQDIGSLLERNMTITTGLRYYFVGNGVEKKEK
jgi:hypothetical protein